MIKVNLILGFLGAGKTTFIKSILDQGQLDNKKVVLIVNDYGSENYDAQLLKESDVEIMEITNGCLCCSNQDGFSSMLQELSSRKDIDRIIIEPSGIFIPNKVVNSFSLSPLDSFMKLEPVHVILDVAF